jgi:O-antigen ligase
VILNFGCKYNCMFKKIYLKSNELLLLIFPISIVFSNFLTNLTVYYISILGLWLLIFKKKNYLNKYFFYIIFFFLLYCSARSFFTTEILFSLKSSITLFRYLFFFIAINFIIEKSNNFLKQFSLILFLFISLMFLDSLIQYFFGKNLFGYQEVINYRISSFFNGRFVLGSYLSKIFLLFLMILNINYKFKNTKTLYFFIFSLFFFATLISGDRSALILLMLSFILFIGLLDNFYLSFKEKIYILMILIISLLNILSFSQGFKNRFIFQTLNDLNFKKNKLVNFPSEGHSSHWRTAFKMYLDNKVFGKGPNMFRHYCDEEQFNSGPKSCSTHPHNYHFQFLAELGLTGYITFLIFFLFTTFKLIKQFYCIYFKNIIYLRFDSLIIFIYLFSIFWPIITTGNVFGSFTLNIIIFVISIMFGIRHKKLINDRLQ